MPKRGFSLIELLIVLGVIAALGALVSINLLGWRDGARFDEAVRRVGAAFVMARSDAQRERRALAVVARPDRDGVALMVEPFEAEDGPVTVAARRLVALPAGVRVSDRLEAAGEDAVPPAAPAAGTDAVRLCVMLPDGGAWAPATVYLLGPEERAARIGVNRWTGTARLEVVERSEGGEEEEGELPAEGDEERRGADGELP